MEGGGEGGGAEVTENSGEVREKAAEFGYTFAYTALHVPSSLNTYMEILVYYY